MKQADNADIQESYRRAIRGILPLGAWVLAALYLLYTISHSFVLPPDVAKVMVPVAGATAAFYFLMALLQEWGKRHADFFINHLDPHFLIASYCLVCVVDAVVHLAKGQQAFQTTDLMIIQIGVASVLLHPPSFLFLNAVILTAWGVLAQSNSHDRLWIHFGFALLATTTLSVIIFAFRRDSIRRLEIKIRTDLKRQKELIYTSKMAALGEMATGIAHEINNPLMIILGKASQLKEQSLANRLNDPDKLISDLDKIESTVMRISKIIKGLRTFARNTEADPKQKACLETIVDETISFCTDRLKSQNIQLSVNKFPKTEILCRPTEISQVLLNLLQNAMDSVEKKSSNSTQSKAARWIRIETSVFQREVSIQVIDSGQGVPIEIQEKIMQPFFTTKEVGQGTGLGLSISRGIIEEHGGRLRYLPHQKETTFEFSLPIASFLETME